MARENTAKEYKAADMKGQRVWVHPASTLFAERGWKSGIVSLLLAFVLLKFVHVQHDR